MYPINKTFGKLPTILILGHARHGKDSAAEFLSDLTGWRFESSSLFAAKNAVYPYLKNKYEYKNLKECFEDRMAHRKEWRDLIRKYNAQDRSRLVKEILHNSNMYVGMRCHLEYEDCTRNKLFDFVLWIDASKRVGEIDPSLSINKNSTMQVIDNNGSLEELKTGLKDWLARTST